MRRPAPSAAERSRQAREPSTWLQGRQQVAQSGAYQNWSRLWNLMYPNLPRGTTPPLVYFGRKTIEGAPVGAGVTLGASAPGAGYRGGNYAGRTMAIPDPASAVDHIAQNPQIIDTLLHETAHTVQSPPVFGNNALAEGGADASAILLRMAAQKMLGAPSPGPYWGYAHQKQFDYGTNRGAYTPHGQGDWFINTFGPGYARRGQFNNVQPPVLPQSPAAQSFGPRPAPPPPFLRALLGALPQPRYS